MKIGMEKEALYYDDQLNPIKFTAEELQDNIILDFASNQIEIISKPQNSVFEALNEVNELQNQELLMKYNIWPLSQPGIKTQTMNFTGFSKQEDVEYRQKLMEKYPLDLLNFSGIHLNISFNYSKSAEEYFVLLKKIYTYGPLILQFFAFTPLYQNGILDQGLALVGQNKGFIDSLSLRNSQNSGYTNEHKYKLDYRTLETYFASLQGFIEKGNISSEKEYYSKVRFKKGSSGNNYLEIRFIDLNPYYRLGISYEQLKLFEIWIKHLESQELQNFDYEEAIANFETIAKSGQNQQKEITILQKKKAIQEHTIDLFEQIIKNPIFCKEEQTLVKDFMNKYQNKNDDIDKMLKEIKEDELSIFEFGKRHMFKKEKFNQLLPEYDLELSTKILLVKANELNYKYKVIDQAQNFVEIMSPKGQKEFVIQATKTNADQYANVLIMENKIMTKYVLQKAGINIAQDQILDKNIDKFDFEKFKKKKIVIKPEDTNFGLGITILEANSSVEVIQKGLNFAFEFSNRIIVEEFFEGIEYRFLVIDGEVISIVKRVPANIFGDGKSSVANLIEQKNQSPLRSQGYKTPAEIIKMGKFEEDFLNAQGKNFDYIPKLGEQVFLRENSNVSTGGDSVEVSDIISLKYRKIASQVASELNVRICGVDMIINHNKNDYIILEANFNPAIQMHTFPILGIGKDPSAEILETIFSKK